MPVATVWRPARDAGGGQRERESATPWKQFLWTSGLDDDGRRLETSSGGGHPDRRVDEHGGRCTSRATARAGRGRRATARQGQWFARTVGLIAVSAYGGVYMDADIGPGTLTLKNTQLYHTDPNGEIGHHAPPFRGPRGYEDVVADARLGDSPRERIVRFADGRDPVIDSFFASRSGTEPIVRELAARFSQDAPASSRDRFARLFVAAQRRPLALRAAPAARHALGRRPGLDLGSDEPRGLGDQLERAQPRRGRVALVGDISSSASACARNSSR